MKQELNNEFVLKVKDEVKKYNEHIDAVMSSFIDDIFVSNMMEASIQGTNSALIYDKEFINYFIAKAGKIYPTSSLRESMVRVTKLKVGDKILIAFNNGSVTITW